MDFLSTFKAARRVGTPLIAVQTPDPAAAIDLLRREGIADTSPIIRWDVVRGWGAVNKAGKQAISAVAGDVDLSQATGNPVESLMMATQLPEKSVLFAINAHRYLSDGSGAGAAFVQAIWNLRDQFKTDLRTLVLMGPQITLPAELGGDVLTIDEPLPTDDELGAVVVSILEAAQQIDDTGALTPEQLQLKEKSVDALRGLAMFPAEQATAMSVTKEGVNIDALWDRKRKMISATPGLSVWRGGDTLDDVGGCENVKQYLRLIFDGKNPPRCVVWIDEIEKMLAGAIGNTQDSSGVSGGFLGQLLTFQQDMNDRGSSGMVFLGPPGAAKSMIAKAAGAQAGIPTIAWDLNAQKASLVGESERMMRNATKVIDAVSGGRALFIATCNKYVNLPPELKRRYTRGTFYFDLPDKSEQAVIWAKYRAKYAIDAREQLPPCDGWTGAEIKTACELHWSLGVKLIDTPSFIVPVVKSAAEEIKVLRTQSDGRFLSASRPGIYTLNAQPEPTDKPVARRLAGKEGI